MFQISGSPILFDGHMCQEKECAFYKLRDVSLFRELKLNV